MELLHQIYDVNNYYVISLDVRSDATRKELSALISRDFAVSDNIRILPRERSFASSWGSYVIQRAQLEVRDSKLSFYRLCLVIPYLCRTRMVALKQTFVRRFIHAMHLIWQCFEELIRMGVWDFVVMLSGRDLALRNVKDMAATLAPYRGERMT